MIYLCPKLNSKCFVARESHIKVFEKFGAAVLAAYSRLYKPQYYVGML